MPPDIVIDTNLLISTAAHPEKTFVAWQAVRRGVVRLIASPGIVSEFREVAARPAFRKSLPALAENVPRFLEEFYAHALMRPDPHEQFVLRDDPKDSLFFNLAIEAEAFAIVSFDRRHILAVGDLSHPQHDELRRLAPTLRLLHPSELNSALTTQHGTAPE